MSPAAAAGNGHDFVRPFIMTGGRTATTRLDLRFETLIRRVPTGQPDASLPAEKVAVWSLCEYPTSVAEIAAGLHLVVGVVKVLVEDLVASGHVEAFTSGPDDEVLELDMLTRITEKIRSL